MKRGHKRSAAAAALFLSAHTGKTTSGLCYASTASSDAAATATIVTSSRNHNNHLLLRRNLASSVLVQRRLTEYDGKIKLGPVHEEVDIYEKKEDKKPDNNANNDNDENANNENDEKDEKAEQDEKELEDEVTKLKGDLAKLEDLDAQLKDEIGTTAGTVSPTAAPPDDEELEKLKADLAKLEDLDSQLKNEIASPDEQPVVQEQDVSSNANGEDGGEDLRGDMDKLKDDLSYLQDLSAEVKDEIATEKQQEEEGEDGSDANDKPSKVEDIAKLHVAEQSITDNPHQTSINVDERDAIEVAVVLENAVAECNEMVAASQSPHAQQRVEDASGSNGKTEAELEVTYEEACCVPPLYSDFCTPSQPREWCDMRLKCLEADRLRGIFLSKIQEEIDAAKSACSAASAAAGGRVTEHNVEMKCCMPPYDDLLPECIDREERARQRDDNKCDDGLEKCVEVKMLIDLRDDTVGMYPNDEDVESGTSATGAANGDEVVPVDSEDDAFKPEVTDHHVNIVDKDADGYVYSAHIGGREEGGGKHLGYKKKEEYHKEDQFSLGAKTASMDEATSSAKGAGLYATHNLWMLSTGVAGMALIILGL